MRSVEESLRNKMEELERINNQFKDELDYKDYTIQQLKQVFFLLLIFIKWMMQVFQATGKRSKKKKKIGAKWKWPTEISGRPWKIFK